MNFQPLSTKANNLRLQQPYFGRLSTAATVRIGCGESTCCGKKKVIFNSSFLIFNLPRQTMPFNAIKRRTSYLRYTISYSVTILFGEEGAIFTTLPIES